MGTCGADLRTGNDKLVVLCVIRHCTAVQFTANVVKLRLQRERRDRGRDRGRERGRDENRGK